MRNNVLENSALVDINTQIVVVHKKKILVSEDLKILLMINSKIFSIYLDIILHLMLESRILYEILRII